MDETTQTVTRQEAQEALEVLKTYAAERRPETVATTYKEAQGRDELPDALKKLEALLGIDGE